MLDVLDRRGSRVRLLILGGNGMIGHRIWLAARDRLDTWTTIREPASGQPWLDLFDEGRLLDRVNAHDPASIDRALEACKPDVVFNAVGLVKQRPSAADAGVAYQVNCFLPHFLRQRCDALGARLIHISTDCVFVGDRAPYAESDQPDALDVYGLSKRLGEVGAPHLTLRTSALGRSLSGATGLLEWLLAQRGRVQGWRRAVFSGLATPALADTVVSVITSHPRLSGTYHVAAEPIDKLALLTRLRDAYALPVEIDPRDEPVIDRSLDDTRFRRETGIARPGWDEMIAALVNDPLPYAQLRGERR